MLCRGDAPANVRDPECTGGQRAGCPGLGGETGLTTAGRGGMCAPPVPGGPGRTQDGAGVERLGPIVRATVPQNHRQGLNRGVSPHFGGQSR
ncbi:unnamed protein product [Gulo gulo]|uniref:Uncharacterized protein n=1 Tax=Gulo gulo TaxID=48420 RepID=A0A9X9PWZ2_GULGU|nr:unnamed protein product [Gulo gulo]